MNEVVRSDCLAKGLKPQKIHITKGDNGYAVFPMAFGGACSARRTQGIYPKAQQIGKPSSAMLPLEADIPR